MITITNVGPADYGDCAECIYEMRVSGTLLGRFKHDPANGVEACLWAAVKVMEKKRVSELARELINHNESEVPNDRF